MSPGCLAVATACLPTAHHSICPLSIFPAPRLTLALFIFRVAFHSLCPGCFAILPDGDAQSYWASGPDPASRVDVQLDFGAARQIKAVEIDWEHPAQVCAICCFLCFATCLVILVCLFRSRRLSCRLPMVGDGQPYMVLLGTICRRPSMWVQLWRALRCGSA